MVEYSAVEDAGLATMDLHSSNLLRMQVAELIDECQLDLDAKTWGAQVEEFIQLISKIVSSVHISNSRLQQQADKPVSVEIIPSDDCLSVLVMGCTKARLFLTTKSGNAKVVPTLELMVQIPETALSGKDFMNYRYFDKRTLVMTCVARELSRHSKNVGNVDVVWIHGCSRPPLLRLSYRKKQSTKIQVYLHFGMKSVDWIPKMRLAPNRSNVKADGAVSQLYNHCLLHDVRHLFEDPYMCDLSEDKNCRAALILIKIWALQRGLWRNHDGWSEASVALLMVYLLRTNAINSRMTPLQLFTVLLQTWANTNWLGEEKPDHRTYRAAAGESYESTFKVRRKRTVLIMPSGKDNPVETAPYSPLSDADPQTLMEAYEFTDSYLLGPVFLDCSMSYNFLGGVSPNFMKLLSWHAQKALQDLRRSMSSFDILFMQRARFWQQWDLYFRVQTVSRKADDWEFEVRALLEKLERGLGNRIHAIRVLSTGNGEFRSEETDSDQFLCLATEQNLAVPCRSTSPTGTTNIVIGVSIDPETSQRVVDRGPPSDRHEELSRFLNLWGEKAQLRRFKDGAIVYSVVWDENHPSFQNKDKWGGGFIENIVVYLLRRHYGSDVVLMSHRGIASTIDVMRCTSPTSNPVFDPFAGHKNVMHAFESLCSVLRESSLGLPLEIEAVEPLAPVLRYSELFPPMPHPFLGRSISSSIKVAGALVFDPILCQVKLRSSSKWPSDLKAISAAKAAMLLKLVEGIEKYGDQEFDGLFAVDTAHAYLGYRGYCFKLMIASDAEINLLRRLARPSPSSLDLLRHLTQKHVIASRHHSLIHAVHTLHPSAGSVVRVARHWADSHLLSGHLSTELIELLVAKVYCDSSVFVEPPGSVPAGFSRFLQLLETFDWKREPLVVDPRGHMNSEDYSDILHAFSNVRKRSNSDESPMYVIAPYNRDCEVSEGDGNHAPHKWVPSVVSPEWVVLKRVIHLANRSHQYLHRCLVAFDDSDWSAVFRETPLAFKSYSFLMRVHQDFIVNLEASSTGGRLELVKSEDAVDDTSFGRSMAALALGPPALRQKGYRNLRRASTNALVPMWNPVRDLVDKLREQFDEHALFFYNQNCPEVICVLWRPQKFSPMPFSVMSSERSHPIDEELQCDSLVSCSLGDIVREIQECSKEIVTTIRIFDESGLSPSSKRQKVDDVDTERGNSALAYV